MSEPSHSRVCGNQLPPLPHRSRYLTQMGGERAVPTPSRKPVIIYDFEDGASTDDEIDMDDRLPLPRGFGEVCASHGSGTHGWCVSIEPTYHDGNDKSREFAKTYLLALESHYGRDRRFIADNDIINHALGYSQSDVAKGHIEAFTYNNHSKRIFWHRKFDKGKLVDVNTPYAPKRVNYNRCFILRSVATIGTLSPVASHAASPVASPVVWDDLQWSQDHHESPTLDNPVS